MSTTSTFDAVEMDMIERGDMLGPQLGARVAAALRSHPEDGWVRVPREPTGAMYGAGGIEMFKADMAQTPPREALGIIYRAMIAAAPSPGASQ